LARREGGRDGGNTKTFSTVPPGRNPFFAAPGTLSPANIRRRSAAFATLRLGVACSRASGVALNPSPCVKVIDAIRAGDLPGAWPELC